MTAVCTRLRHTARNVAGTSMCLSSPRDDRPLQTEDRATRATMSTPYTIFLFKGEEDPSIAGGLGAQRQPRAYKFVCSAPKCPVQVKIFVKPPQFFGPRCPKLWTNQAQLRRRWEVAKQMAGERADQNMARSVDAPDYLNTYLGDSLNPVKGKARIPLLNRKIPQGPLERDCDSILTRLGFTNTMEEEEGGTMVEVWYLPKPEEGTDPLQVNSAQRD